jgi:hypothetical protein
MKFPQITVSADLRKCLNGRPEIDMVKGIVPDDVGFKVTEFNSFARAIDETWNSDQSKFNMMIILSEFMRGKLDDSDEGSKERNWLVGCMRNLDSVLSSIILLEQAEVRPENFNPGKDRNLKIFLEAWEILIEKDPAIKVFRTRMGEMTSKDAWKLVFKKSLNIDSVAEINTLVFHGFYYITPYQERVMKLLEQAGFQLIFLIPYDERYPYVYEIWDETYSVERGYDPKSSWHIEKSFAENPYGEIFEGRSAKIHNKLKMKEYASVMEFVDDVKHIKERGFSIYSADHKSANQILKDYFPDAYGDRKILSYPIGQFISNLNRMWDDEQQTIVLNEDRLIECFSSGWLAVDGISGKQYMQDLMYVLPFFNGCHTIEEWEKRIRLFAEIKESVIAPFEVDLDPDIAVSRWQEAIGSPLKNFSMFAVEIEKLDVILNLIKQLLGMAKELFGKNELVRVHDHIRTLDEILKRYELSQELYVEERNLVKDIFEKLRADNNFDAKCHPADIARALDLFICGRYEEGEIQTNRVGLVYPLYFIDAACVKNKSKVHICLSDVDSLPGGNKDYVWPLTGKKMKETYRETKNPLIQNLIQIMESTTLCNRYFIYCALMNKEVEISWVSTIGEKRLAPSPYIKLLLETTGIKLTPAARNAISFNRVTDTPMSLGRIEAYDNEKAPVGMIKEARMDYALCPMKYVLGYVVEKYPTYQSDFQMNYALNAFISAIFNLMKEQGMKVDEAYEAVVALFPNMRKVEKRQVYDYISYDRRENDMDYGNRTECGEKYYTDERLKIHYPNQDVRSETLARYGKLNTPDGRRGMDLNEVMEVPDACIFCQHVSYCRNALYAGDQENYYD